MCKFHNDRFEDCGHEHERKVYPCHTIPGKFCPNSEDNTKNTKIEGLCDDCKNRGLKPPVPIVAKHASIKRTFPEYIYCKPGEEHIPTPPVAKILKMIEDHEARLQLEQARLQVEKWCAPNVEINDDEPPASMSSSWTEVEDDLKGEGVFVNPPNEEEDAAKSKPKSKKTNSPLA